MPRLTALGCDYIQLDAPNYAQWHVDPDNRAAFAAWGHDMDAELVSDAEIDHLAFEGLRGVSRAIYICRGNAPGAGTFGPLRHVRPGTQVVLGLLTTKRGALEDPGTVEARIREAARHLPLDRLALSPQGGFASGEAGNPVTPEEQEAKLRLVGVVARTVWPV